MVTSRKNKSQRLIPEAWLDELAIGQSSVTLGTTTIRLKSKNMFLTVQKKVHQPSVECRPESNLSLY